MAWMNMPGQWWLPAAMFVAMWTVMMVAMMVPSLLPTLWNYRCHLEKIGTGHTSALTALAGASYFLVWACVGVGAYALGTLVTAAAMRSLWLARSVPVAAGAVLLLAGCFQVTPWKARRLATCRDEACNLLAIPNAGRACRQGIRWGMDCSLCCFGYMAVLLVTGIMNLAAMTILATVIAVERIAPFPERTARIAGILLIVTGTFMIAGVLRA